VRLDNFILNLKSLKCGVKTLLIELEIEPVSKIG